MATLAEAFNIALEHHRAGRLDLAQETYRRILAVEPHQSDCLHLLGVIAYQTGQSAQAVEQIQRAIAFNPSVPAYYLNLGNALLALGKLDEAENCQRHAIELNPGDAAARNNLGNVLMAQGRVDEGMAAYEQALKLDPHHPEANNNLGNALQTQGKLLEAVACYRQALQGNPAFVDALNNLGVALAALGNTEEGITCYLQALQCDPRCVRAYYNLGIARKNRGQLAEAIACYQRALELQPDHSDALNNLGLALAEAARPSDAENCYRRALEVNPDDSDAWSNLGNTLANQGRIEEAVGCHWRALSLKPNLAPAWNNLATACQTQGKLEEAVQAYRRALELNPNYTAAHSNWLYCEQYRPETTLASLTSAMAEWNRRHAAPLQSTWRPFSNSRDPGRRLRLGFVSADFAVHPVGWFLVRAMEELRGSDCDALCYNDRARGDEVMSRFQAAATRWIDVVGLSHAALAERIRADQVDILFDLTGHVGNSRLLTFARKPAPVQITWIGSIGGTGLQAIDYVLGDRHVIPPEAESGYVERVLRMPDCWVCYDPQHDAPPVGPLPAIGRQQFTFGSFNNPAKLHPGVIEVWSRILNRIPDSRLILKFLGCDDAGTRRHLADQFARHGVNAARLEMRGVSPRNEYLRQYQEIDLALDPFPHAGGLTTCDALWMGVPVVTCPGDTFVSRQGLSFLSTIGVTDTVARNHDEYVELAVALAQDLLRLAGIRARLRPEMAASPLCDGRRFAAALRDVLRGAWRRWCEAQ
jgi:predicted O-linked N-acetylglucosamine transferase (SPINDLY family)